MWNSKTLAVFVLKMTGAFALDVYKRQELNKIIETDTADMQRIIGGQNNVERFIKLVKKYENITELTPCLLYTSSASCQSGQRY